MGSREGAPVRMNTQQLENFSRGRGGLQEMSSREEEHLQGELQLGKRWAPGRGLQGGRTPSGRASAGEEVGCRERAPQGSRWEREKGSTVDEVLRVKMLDTGLLVRASKVLRGPGLHI